MTNGVATRGRLTIRRAEPVMGTVISFDVRPQGVSAAQAREAVTRACQVLHDADAIFSLYRVDSPMSRIRAGRLSVASAPPAIAQVLDLCEEVREMSGGWFDPWALPGGVDPTGLVKGWAAEQALSGLRDAGIGAAMVNAAGDIAVFGSPAAGRRWRIGVRTPRAADELCCVLEPEAAVATSGQYERGTHVLDPRTAQPAAAALSATVCGPHLTVADGLATGLLAAGRIGLDLVAAAGYEAMIIDSDGVTALTPAFPLVA